MSQHKAPTPASDSTSTNSLRLNDITVITDRTNGVDGNSIVPENPITPHQVWQAAYRIQSYVRHTPVIYSTSLQAYLKLENIQDIGAFKVRGAANAILSLSEEERRRGVTTFSTGNHGLAVAHVAQQLGIPAVICISNDVPPRKVNAIASTKAQVRVVGHSQDEAEQYCSQLQKEEGFTIIKPFDDANVIAGQGTIGLELLQDLPDLDAVIVPLSGGGLIAGISLALKANHPGVRVIGVSMKQGAAMYQSIQAGRPVAVEESSTLADSLRGGIGLENAYTFAMVQSLVDEIVLVPENAIADGMRYMFKEHGMVVEGAAGTGVGAILHHLIPDLSGHVAVIVTGRNADDQVLYNLLQTRNEN